MLNNDSTDSNSIQSTTKHQQTQCEYTLKQSSILVTSHGVADNYTHWCRYSVVNSRDRGLEIERGRLCCNKIAWTLRRCPER